VRVLFLVWRVEVEINSAERTVTVGLAEDDGQLTIERDAVTQMRAAVQISFIAFSISRTIDSWHSSGVLSMQTMCFS